MRKLVALFILILIFIPLMFGTMTLTAIRPWVFDRGFYERLVGDERLYEAMLDDPLPQQFNNELFTPVEQLPVSALAVALRDIMTTDYLRSQSVNVVNQVFDYLEGRNHKLELSMDIRPIKALLVGESKMQFSTTLAENLPACTTDQPKAPNGRLIRCVSIYEAVASVAEKNAEALPAVLEDTPDSIRINDYVPIKMNWYDYGWFPETNVLTIVDFAIMNMLVVGVIVGVIGAYIGGNHLRGRLQWLSAALFVPSSLFLVIGMVMTSPLIVAPLSSSLSATRWDGLAHSEAYRETVISVLVPVVQQIGSGFLLTGVIACAIVFGLLVWSWVTPSTTYRPGNKVVQVPLHTA